MYLLCQTCPNLDVLLRIFIPVRKNIRKYAYMSYRRLEYVLDFE